MKPADFIPVFEKNGFIVKMDECIWEQTCQILRAIVQLAHNLNYDVITEGVEREDQVRFLLEIGCTAAWAMTMTRRCRSGTMKKCTCRLCGKFMEHRK